MNQEEAVSEYAEVAIELTARAIAARRLGRNFYQQALKNTDKEERRIFMRQSGLSGISSLANIVATKAAKTTLKDTLTAIDATNTDWSEFRYKNTQIYFARPGRKKSLRKIDTKIHNTIFHSSKTTSSQPALFDLSPSISNHQETSYRRKGLRASPNTMFCQLLIETGAYGLPIKSTFSALTASISDPLFTFEVDLEAAEAVANQLVKDKAPELEFTFTILNNIAEIVAPSTSVPPTPAPNVEVRRALDTEETPNEAPFSDEKNKSQQEG